MQLEWSLKENLGEDNRLMKSFRNYFWKILLAVSLLVLLQLVFGFIFGIQETLTGLPLIFLSNLLVVLVLTYAIVRTNTYGLKLVSAVSLLFFGINVFNTQIEAIFFQLQIPRTESINMFFQGFLVTLIFSYMLVFLMERMHKPASNVESRTRSSISIIGYVWRFVVCDISYVILYCIAGAIILPYVQDFYSNLAQTPDLDKVLIMQVFRGLIYVIVTLPVVRMIKAKRWEAALIIGLQLSILGGIAPLLPPNPYMPVEIRLVHGIEIGISNFIYGAIMGLLFASKLKE
jgi:hypothetical protein